MPFVNNVVAGAGFGLGLIVIATVMKILFHMQFC